MANFSIKDLAEFSGIKPHTIRVWEQRYSFLHPQRSATARRTYSTEELNILLDVALLNQMGHKISHIDKMSFEEKLQAVSQITDQQQKSIHDLIIAMANMNAGEFEEALNRSIKQWGIDSTIQQVMLPFSDMIGLLQSGTDKAYIENILVVVQSIKQKIYRGIEENKGTKGREKILLFQPAGEPEALSLLYLQYIFKKDGYEPLHVGQLTGEHLRLIYQQTKPDYIITHAVKKGSSAKKMEELADSLSYYKEPPVFISIENRLRKKGAQFRYAASMSEAIEIVSGALEPQV